MRSTRTTEEQEAVAALDVFLKKGGYENVIELEEWTDNPDVIFKTKSGRIACEISTVVPDTIIQWYFKKLPELPIASSREIVMPREPHEWAMKIISAKNKKILQYKERSKSNTIWLLIHSSEKTSKILQPASTEDIELLRFAAHTTNHKFKKILFFDRSGNVIELYDHKQRQEIKINYNFISSGYPTYVLREVLLGPVSGLVNGAYSEVKIEFDKLKVGDQIVLPPMDKMYARVSPNIAVQDEVAKLTFGEKTDISVNLEPNEIFPEFFEKMQN